MSPLTTLLTMPTTLDEPETTYTPASDPQEMPPALAALSPAQQAMAAEMAAARHVLSLLLQRPYQAPRAPAVTPMPAGTRRL